MSEKPILFSAPMVRALLSGKTQTRRIVKLTSNGLAKLAGNHAAYLRDGIGLTWIPFGGAKEQPMPAAKILEMSPYGSRLWVRETWAAHNCYDSCKPSEIHDNAEIFYRADFPSDFEKRHPGVADHRPGKWRPSIFIPRWASRITLAVKAVRCERLWSIIEDDAQAEGLLPIANPDYDEDEPCDDPEFSHVAAFARLWDKLNGKKHPWESDPWVWVIEFERSKP